MVVQFTKDVGFLIFRIANHPWILFSILWMLKFLCTIYLYTFLFGEKNLQTKINYDEQWNVIQSDLPRLRQEICSDHGGTIFKWQAEMDDNHLKLIHKFTQILWEKKYMISLIVSQLVFISENPFCSHSIRKVVHQSYATLGTGMISI